MRFLEGPTWETVEAEFSKLVGLSTAHALNCFTIPALQVKKIKIFFVSIKRLDAFQFVSFPPFSSSPYLALQQCFRLLVVI